MRLWASNLPALGLSLVLVLAAAGLAWHECLLLVTAAIAAQRLELWRMDRAAPRDGWRIGAHCLVAGGAGLGAAAALGLALLAARAGWWQPSHEQPLLAVALIAGSGAIITVMQPRADRFFAEAALWSLLAAGAAAGLLAALGSSGDWACAASGAGVVYLACTSWLLLRGGASFLRTG